MTPLALLLVRRFWLSSICAFGTLNLERRERRMFMVSTSTCLVLLSKVRLFCLNAS